MACDPRKSNRKRKLLTTTVDDSRPVSSVKTSRGGVSLPITKAASTTPRYRYIKLKNAFDQIGTCTANYLHAHVFGVIVEYNETNRELTIKDETYVLCVKITINGKQPDDATRDFLRSFRPGDIIRIHRLILYKNSFMWNIPKIHNVVLFDPFIKKPVPRLIAKDATFEATDKQHIKELISWECEQLLHPRATLNNNFLITNGAFVVLHIEPMPNDRAIIVCLNGRPVPGYPCSRLLNKNHMTARWRALKASHEGQFAFFLGNLLVGDFDRLYDSNSIFFLNAFGNHAAFATSGSRRLQPLDVIVAHNILIKPDAMFGGYSYLLYNGSAFGRALRKAEDESTLGRLLCRQIWLYSYILQKPNYELVTVSEAGYEQLADEVKEQLGEGAFRRSSNWSDESDSDADTDVDEEEFAQRDGKKFLSRELDSLIPESSS